MIIRGEPMWFYHCQEALSASKLAVFRECPLLYKLLFLDGSITREKTKALEEGAGFDSLLFDGEEQFAANYITTPPTYTNEKKEVKPWRFGAKVTDAWKDEQENAGRTILTGDAMDRFRSMRDAIRSSPLAAALLAKGEAQVVFRRHSEKFGIDVQVRPDWLCMEPIDVPGLGLTSNGLPYLLDLKTTETFSDWVNPLNPNSPRIGKAVRAYGYDRQAALAQFVAKQDIGRTAHFLLVVEKHAPFRVGVVILSNNYLEKGWLQVSGDLTRLAACKLADKWPGSPEVPITLEPDQWELDAAVAESVASGLPTIEMEG